MTARSPSTTPIRRLWRGATASVVACVLIGVLATATAGAAASTTGGAASTTGATARCARIAFAKQSDDLAFNINASAAPCSLARAVASASTPTWPNTRAERTYKSHGFTCTGRLVLPGGKAYEHYVCLRRTARIVFDRA